MNQFRAQLPDSLRFKVVLGMCIVTTVAIAPELLIDPINSIKMSTLLIGTLMSVFLISLNKHIENSITKKNVALIITQICSVIFFLSYIYAVIKSNDLTSSVWGVFGRNTGAITMISLIIVFWVVSLMDLRKINKLFANSLVKTTYIVLIYAFIQILEIDPIRWSNSEPVSFLGNINFVSGLFGMTGAVLLVRLLNSKSKASIRAHSAFLLAIFCTYWLTTGSIQGLLILLSVLFVLGMLALCKYSWINRFFWPLFSFSLAVPAIGLYLAGESRLERIPQIETLFYRLDYWTAAISMIKSSPFFGKGIDSYGLFYREFRSQSALDRGNPDRTSNTAHNIFLDVGVSVGTLGLLAIGLLFFTVFVISVNKIKATKIQEYDQASEILAIFVAYIVFCLISINQIGVSVWGWVAGGVLLSNYRFSIPQFEAKESLKAGTLKKLPDESKLDNLKKQRISSLPRKSFVYNLIKRSILGVATALFLLLPYISNQFNFLNELKENDIQAMRKIAVEGKFVDEFVRETYMERTISQNDLPATREIAEVLLSSNPRNFFALTTLVNLTDSDAEERQRYKDKLVQIDPLNVKLKQDLKSLVSAP